MHERVVSRWNPAMRLFQNTLYVQTQGAAVGRSHQTVRQSWQRSRNELVRLRHELLDEINPHEDSLRLYMLGEDASPRVEHYGQKPSQDFEGPLVV
jgi:hypothetical protein